MTIKYPMKGDAVWVIDYDKIKKGIISAVKDKNIFLKDRTWPFAEEETFRTQEEALEQFKKIKLESINKYAKEIQCLLRQIEKAEEKLKESQSVKS